MPLRTKFNIGSGNGLVSSGQQAMTLVNADPDLCRLMATLVHKGLMNAWIKITSIWYVFIANVLIMDEYIMYYPASAFNP